MIDGQSFASLYLEGNSHLNFAAQTTQRRELKHLRQPLTFAKGAKLQRQFGEGTNDTSP